MDHDLLPLTSLFIEPAKVLFLNNAINHGVLTPLGTAQALGPVSRSCSAFEANPGRASDCCWRTWFREGHRPASAPGAAIIQFFGGIHEIVP